MFLGVVEGEEYCRYVGELSQRKGDLKEHCQRKGHLRESSMGMSRLTWAFWKGKGREGNKV